MIRKNVAIEERELVLRLIAGDVVKFIKTIK